MYIYIASHAISCAFPHPRKRPWAPVVVKCLHMPPTQKLSCSVAHSLAFSAVAQVGGKDVTGLKLEEVNKLLKQFDEMSAMMKRMNKLGQKGLMRGGLSALMPGLGNRRPF